MIFLYNEKAPNRVHRKWPALPEAGISTLKQETYSNTMLEAPLVLELRTLGWPFTRMVEAPDAVAEKVSVTDR